jgi:hypothetical protein
MAIRVKGATRKFTSEEILKRSIGRTDQYGNPFEIINLDWNPAKKCGHGSKTKGDFDDVMLIRNKSGTAITYRNPGSIEWLKDGFTGSYSAMVARTTKNLRLLASMHYDKLWTIREAHIRQIVEKMADVIDEENKKVMIEHVVVEHQKQPNGTVKRVERRIKESMYELHKRRREAHFKGPRGEGSIVRPMALETHQEYVADAKDAEVNRKLMDIEQREAALLEREKALNITPPPEDNIMEPISDEYSREDLEKLVPVSKLKKLARDEFGIEKAFSIPKDELIDLVLEKQMEPEPEGAVTR